HQLLACDQFPNSLQRFFHFWGWLAVGSCLPLISGTGFGVLTQRVFQKRLIKCPYTRRSCKPDNSRAFLSGSVLRLCIDRPYVGGYKPDRQCPCRGNGGDEWWDRDAERFLGKAPVE